MPSVHLPRVPAKHCLEVPSSKNATTVAELMSAVKVIFGQHDRDQFASRQKSISPRSFRAWRLGWRSLKARS
jgi:hypothetical protein